MKISVAVLRRAANILFDHLESRGVGEIEVEQDYYWYIPEVNVYPVHDEPTEFTMGRLADSVEWITEIGEGQKEPISFALVWLASLLRYVGAKVVA